jgi:hypothetical protein
MAAFLHHIYLAEFDFFNCVCRGSLYSEIRVERPLLSFQKSTNFRRKEVKRFKITSFINYPFSYGGYLCCY